MHQSAKSSQSPARSEAFLMLSADSSSPALYTASVICVTKKSTASTSSAGFGFGASAGCSWSCLPWHPKAR